MLLRGYVIEVIHLLTPRYPIWIFYYRNQYLATRVRPLPYHSPAFKRRAPRSPSTANIYHSLHRRLFHSSWSSATTIASASPLLHCRVSRVSNRGPVFVVMLNVCRVVVVPKKSKALPTKCDQGPRYWIKCSFLRYFRFVRAVSSRCDTSPRRTYGDF